MKTGYRIFIIQQPAFCFEVYDEVLMYHVYVDVYPATEKDSKPKYVGRRRTIEEANKLLAEVELDPLAYTRGRRIRSISIFQNFISRLSFRQLHLN